MCGICGTNCGSKCKKTCIKVYRPTVFIGGQTGIPGEDGDPGISIVNIIDNGDGTMTIVMSDSTEYIIPIPSSDIPNDDWVVFDQTDPQITSFDVNSGITTHSQEVQVAYKPIAVDTALVKVKARLNVTIPNDVGFNLRDVDRLLSFDFILANIPIGGSEWFPTQTGTLTALFPDFLLGDNFGVPVSITSTTVVGGLEDPLAFGDFQSKGRGSVTNGLFFCQQVGPAVAAGRYSFLIEWEMICRIEHF